MLSEDLQGIDELLAILSGIRARLGAIQTAIATCSFGSWEGQAAQAAQEDQRQIITDMNTLYTDLNAAESHFEECRAELLLTATTAP